MRRTGQALLAAYAPQVKSFLGTEAAEAIFTELDQKYFRDFKDADTDDARRMAWAKSQALADVRTSFQAVVDAAEFEEHQQERRSRQA